MDSFQIFEMEQFKIYFRQPYSGAKVFGQSIHVHCLQYEIESLWVMNRNAISRLSSPKQHFSCPSSNISLYESYFKATEFDISSQSVHCWKKRTETRDTFELKWVNQSCENYSEFRFGASEPHCQ